MFYSLLILLERTACWSILDWQRTVSDRTTAHFVIAGSERETEEDGEEKENLCCVLYQALKEFHTAHLAALRALVSQSTKSFKSALFKSYNTRRIWDLTHAAVARCLRSVPGLPESHLTFSCSALCFDCIVPHSKALDKNVCPVKRIKNKSIIKAVVKTLQLLPAWMSIVIQCIIYYGEPHHSITSHVTVITRAVKELAIYFSL